MGSTPLQSAPAASPYVRDPVEPPLTRSVGSEVKPVGAETTTAVADRVVVGAAVEDEQADIIRARAPSNPTHVPRCRDVRDPLPISSSFTGSHPQAHRGA